MNEPHTGIAKAMADAGQIELAAAPAVTPLEGNSLGMHCEINANGRVHLEFDRAIRWFQLSKEEALDLGRTMIRLSKRAKL